MKSTLITLTAILLVSCSSNGASVEVAADHYVIRTELANLSSSQKPTIHSVSTPKKEFDDAWLTYVDDVDNFDISYPADYPKEFPYFMEDMSIERQDSPSPCPPSLTGVSKPIELQGTNGKTVWGKADISESFREEGWEYEEWKDIVCPYEGIPRPTAVYALCSEKDEKTVVICITQMTDDPELAKQIFETFRWME